MVKVFFVGRLTRDPRTNEVGGNQVCNMDVAADTATKGADGKYISNYYEVAMWGARAATCATLTKGRQVAVVGSLTQMEYKKKDGTTDRKLVVKADDVQFTGPSPSAGQSAAPRNAAPSMDELLGGN